MDTIQGWVTLAKDIITALAATIAAYVALTGLQTWKRQLTANAEYALARRVLAAVYKVRDAIMRYRLPSPLSDFKGPELQAAGKLFHDETKKLHEKFLKELEDADAALAVELLEAEAVWGNDLDYRDSFVRFQGFAQTAQHAHLLYYSDIHIEYADNTTAKENARSIVFTKAGSYPRDEFSNKLIDAVRDIEDFLRPKLTLKQGKDIKRRWRPFMPRR